VFGVEIESCTRCGGPLTIIASIEEPQLIAKDAPLPDDAAIGAVLGAPRRASSTISSVEPFRVQVARWYRQGVGGVAIHSALWREQGFRGSYSSVRR